MKESLAGTHTTPDGWMLDLRITSSTPELPPDIACSYTTESEAIREMWKRYEFIVNTSRDFMNLIDRNYIYQAVNDPFLSALNKTREEIMGKSVADIWGKKIFESAIKPCFDQCFAGNIIQADFSIDIPKHGLSYFNATYYPYYNADREITHAVVVSHDITIRRQTAEWLRYIIEGTAKSTGANFFRDLVRHMAAVTGVRVTFASELMPENSSQARSLATWTTSGLSHGSTWNLDGTPCANITQGNTLFFAKGVQKKFPGNIWLKEIAAESYLGIPFQDSSGNITGYIGIIDDKPMSGKGEFEQILRIFAERAGAELERECIEKQLKLMAHHDGLTGLPNRFLFFDHLTHARAQARRRKENFSVLFIDLDNFKDINDTLGHETGDLLLKEVAIRLRRCVREVDTIARIGGDEFTIILMNTQTRASVKTVAKKVLAALDRPFSLSGGKQFVGVSIGISTYPTDSENSDMLVRLADAAMYQAKHAGKNTFRFWERGLPFSP